MALLGRLLRNDGYGLNILSLPDHAVLLIALCVQAALFVTLFFPRPPHEPERLRWMIDGALLMVSMVLFSPTCWIATYNALLLPVCLALALLYNRPRTAWTCPPLAATTLACGLLSLMTHAKFWRALGISHIKGESYVYLVLMILPWFGLSLFATLWWQRYVSLRPLPRG